MKIKSFLIKFIMAFIIGWVAFHYLTKIVELDKNPTPWILITLILTPFGYAVAALFKISEVNEHPSLSRAELRRLDPIVATKKKSLSGLVIYYMISASCIAVGLFALNVNSVMYFKFLSICGGLVLSSMYSFFYIKSIMDEIQRFKSLLIHRVEEDKKRNELLDLLNKKADK